MNAFPIPRLALPLLVLMGSVKAGSVEDRKDGSTTDIDGCDLSAEMRGGTEHQVFAYAFHEAIEYQNMAVYDGEHKLLHFPHGDRTELYDLASDPHEMVDLAANADQADHVQELVVDAALGLLRHTRAIGHRVSPW